MIIIMIIIIIIVITIIIIIILITLKPCVIRPLKLHLKRKMCKSTVAMVTSILTYTLGKGGSIGLLYLLFVV